MVLMSGEVIRLGGKHLDSDGYDLLGIVTGFEGMLGDRDRGDGAHPALAAGRARSLDRIRVQ